MQTHSPRPLPFSSATQQKLLELMLALSTVQIKQIIWDSCLSEEERTELGDDHNQYLNSGKNIVRLWMVFRGRSQVHAILELAKKVNLLNEMTYQKLMNEVGEITSSAPDPLAIAMNKAKLVLCEQPRSLYWNGAEIPMDWDNLQKLWSYIDGLITAAKKNQSIDKSLISSSSKDRNYLSKLKSRLSLLTENGQPVIPVELLELIEVTKGDRHKLNVPPDQICILRLAAHEVLSEE